MKKDRYYFSHDYTARKDDKILALRAKFKAQGYGIFWMLIEVMAENEHGVIEKKYLDGYAMDFDCDKKLLEELINFCIKIKLFKISNRKISNERIHQHKAFREERKKSGKRGASERWKDDG